MKQKNLIKYPLMLIALCITCLSIFFTCHDISAASLTRTDGHRLTGTIYINNSYTLKVSGYSVYFYSSQKSVASINKTTGKLTLKIPGKFTVIAKNRKNGHTIAKKTFTVRRRTDYLTVPNKQINLLTGQYAYASAKKNPSFSTDALYYKSSNPSIVAVNSSSGHIKGINAGSATITCYSKSSSITPLTSKHMRKIKLSVSVKSSLKSVKQTALKQITITFHSPSSNLSISDFSIKNSSGKSVKIISVSSPAAQSETAVLTLAEPLCDGLRYSVSYYSSTKYFTTSNGIIKSFQINPVKTAINTETSITASGYDQNGMLLEKYTYGTTYDNVLFTVNSAYLTQNNTLKFTQKNQIAQARIILYKNINGVKTISADSGYVTIVSYDDTAERTTFLCNISNEENYTFPTIQNQEYNMSLSANDYSQKAYFNFITETGDEIPDYSIYHIESSNNSILTGYSYLNNSQKYALIYPIGVGTANLFVKDSTNAVVHTFTVTVTPARKASSISISNHSIRFPDNSTVGTYAVNLSVLDQFNKPMPEYTKVTKVDTTTGIQVAASYTLTCYNCVAYGNSPDIVNLNSNQKYYTLEDGYIIFNCFEIPAGIYTYTVNAAGLSKTITVTISGSSSYTPY